MKNLDIWKQRLSNTEGLKNSKQDQFCVGYLCDRQVLLCFKGHLCKKHLKLQPHMKLNVVKKPKYMLRDTHGKRDVWRCKKGSN